MESKEKMKVVHMYLTTLIPDGRKIEKIKRPEKLIGYYIAHCIKVMILLDGALGVSLSPDFNTLLEQTEGMNSASRVKIINAHINSLLGLSKEASK